MSYAVIGCPKCSELWIVEELRRQQTVSCPCCGHEAKAKTLRKLFTGETQEVAAEYRSRRLADRAGYDPEKIDDYRDQAHQAERHLGWYNEIYADHAEEYLGRYDDLYGEAVQERIEAFQHVGGRAHERAPVGSDFLVDEAETYLERRFCTAEDTHLVEYEPEYSLAEEGLRLAPTPPAQQRLSTIQVDVPPTVSDWLPSLLDRLLDPLVRAVQELAEQYGERNLSTRIVEEVLPDDLVDDRLRSYITILTSYALRLDEPDDVVTDTPREERYEQLREHAESELTNVGTGRGIVQGSGAHVLAGVIVPILTASDVLPEFVLDVDGEAWMDEKHRETRQSSLDAIAALADAGETTVVCGPAVEQYLCDRHPDWVECVTERCNPGRDSRRSRSGEVPDELVVYNELQTMDKRPGKLRVLSHIERNPGATIRDMASDPVVDLEENSVRAYVGPLEDKHGYITIDRAGETNTHNLTNVGKLATSLLGENNQPFHPGQTTVIGEFAGSVDASDEPSFQRATGTQQYTGRQCCGTNSSGEGKEGQTAEDVLAATGDAGEEGYVQWLPKMGGSSWPLHNRVLAADRADGVTFNEHPVKEWDDARVTYLSCLRDHVVVSAQYSGPLRTLVRLATTLLSDKAWGKILTPSALGDELDNCYDRLEDDVARFLRHGAQIGWFSEDEENYDDLRDRLNTIRCLLLERLGQLDDLDQDERTRLFEDAHGLLMSATALYHAVDLPITFDLRVPNPNVTDDEQLVQFLKQTVPKHGSYGVHSVYRNHWEGREQKRKWAMAREVHPDDPAADLRATWVVSSPHADVYRRETEEALRETKEDLQEGMEDFDPIELPIEVADANGYAGMRYAVERFLKQKDMMPYGDEDAIRRTVRLFMAYTSSPFDVADAFIGLMNVHRDVELRDVEAALAALPANRLLPDKAPTVGKVLKVLFEADNPLGRSEIADRADVHTGSFDRHIPTLAALDLIERVDGTAWTATVMPWYATGSERSGPEDSVYSASTADLPLGDAAFEVLDQLGVDVGDPAIASLFGPGGTVDTVGLREQVAPEIAEWVDLLETFTAPLDEVGAIRTIAIGDRPDQATFSDTTGGAAA